MQITLTVATSKADTATQGVAIKLSLLKSDNTLVESLNVAAPYSGVFSNVPDGTGYTVRAVAVDVAGIEVGTAIVSTPFEVVTPPAQIQSDVPVSISVSVVP